MDILTKGKGGGARKEDLPMALPMDQLMQCFICSEDFRGQGQAALLAHFSTKEYRLELERSYVERPGAGWAKDQNCPQCGLNIPNQADFTRHIGVEHRAVEQFLPARLGVKFKQNIDKLRQLSKKS